MTMPIVLTILSWLTVTIFGAAVSLNILAIARGYLRQFRLVRFLLDSVISTVARVAFLLVLSDTDLSKRRWGPYQ